ncbi:MAG: exosome complex RNA-binding protein Rrp4 [Candidatus Aenigmatarchaeota archaeon]
MEVREIVLPGEKIGERKGRRIGRGAYAEGEEVFAKVLGIPKITENEITVVALSGVYIPSVGDMVIGTISDIQTSGWVVDINSPYTAFLPISEAVGEYVDILKTDISRYYDLGELIYCKISKVAKNKTVTISMKTIGARKLYGGTTIKITPTKIPRVIGRGGSMITILKSKSGCEIIAGQNGIVWINGVNKAKVIEAILTIEKESHLIGLTEKIERMLSE